MALKDMKMGTKLFGGFGIVLLLMILIGFFGYQGISKMIVQKDISDNVLATRAGIGDMTAAVLRMILYTDAKYLDVIGEGHGGIAKSADLAKVKMDSVETKSLVDDIVKSSQEYQGAAMSYWDMEQRKQVIVEQMKKAEKDSLLELDGLLKLIVDFFQKNQNDFLNFEKYTVTSNAVDSVQNLQIYFREYLAKASQETRDKMTAEISRAEKAVGEVGKLLVTDAGQKACRQIEESLKIYKNQFELFLGLADQQAKALVSLREASGRAIANIDQSNKTINDYILKFSRATTRQIIVVIILAILIGMTIAVVLTAGVTKPVQKAVGLAEALCAGDLSIRLKLGQKDEIGVLADALDNACDAMDQKAKLSEVIASGDLTPDVALASEKDALGNALKGMVESLNQVLAEVKTAVEQVADGSGQVSDASQSLSQGATEQASSLEEITSSMTEMGSQTKQNAENASKASELAVTAKNKAEAGNKRMQEMLESMKGITQASQEIAKVIKVIDDIAFQTNLLALNAAVEAARAGQHGKGFAVVAEEVRNLAGRSAKAAQETADLIEGTIKQVDQGGKIAADTGVALNEIVEQVTKATNLIGEIAAASNEQAQGIGQVSQGLSQIDQVTQQNTANAEETAAAAEEMSGQAVELQKLVSRFKLKGVQSTVASAAPAKCLADQSKSKMQAKKTVNKKEAGHEINLDDSEFGKY